nr:PREDICTED: uncharacterized protein LOC102354611 [Latimeria chalumnae]|eukprot:XP_006001253.1 PREDICTED: uncharacterized protein LOC102354611 [Latimeria chalumnae]
MLTNRFKVWTVLLILSVILAKVISDPPVIRTLEELKNTRVFEHRPPAHGYALLWWFATEAIHLDNNDRWRLNFPLNLGTYGFHRFNNWYDNNAGCCPLPPAPPRASYYAVGNLNPNTYPRSRDLPRWVTQYYQVSRRDSKRDRMVIAVAHNSNTNSIDHVYLTSHYYSFRTFEIDLWVLDQIRNLQFKTFMMIVGYGSSSSVCSGLSRHFMRQKRDLSESECNELVTLETQLAVKMTADGKASLDWKHIPWAEGTSWIGLYKDDSVGDWLFMTYTYISGQNSGSYDTSYPLQPGMQARYFRTKAFDSVFRSSELSESCGKAPTQISNFGDGKAFLQLVVKDGKAGAKFYINRDHVDWQKHFYNAWVGFYEHPSYDSTQYSSYQWVTYFNKVDKIGEYDVYTDGHNRLTLSPDTLIRFFGEKGYKPLLSISWQNCYR